MWTISKVFIELVTILLLFYSFWFSDHKACGILAPWPVVEPIPPVLEEEILTTGPPVLEGKVLTTSLCYAMLSHFSCVRLCETLETAAYQAPPSLGFSRQELWSGLPFPSPMHESEKGK